MRDPKTGRFPARPENPKGGEGWGGDAKGAGKGPEALPMVGRSRETNARVAAEARTLREMLRPHLGLAAQAWLDVLLDPDAPAAAKIAAAEKIAERVEGKVSDKLALIDTRSADELTDDDLAIIASRGRSATADEAAPQD
jgi:hypothetical protein